MSRRPYKALGTIPTQHGEVIVRPVLARKQGTYVLVLDGAHLALRALLPAWRPRALSTRTQVTPDHPTRKPAEIRAFYNAVLPLWLGNLTRSSEPFQATGTSPPVPTYTTLKGLIAIVDAEIRTSLRPSSVETYRSQWKTICRFIPCTEPLTSLTRERLQQLVGELSLDGYAVAQIKNLLTALNRVLVRAVEDDVLPKNPLTKVVVPRSVKKDKRYLTLEQRDRVMREAAHYGQNVLLLFGISLFLGLRKSEVLALHWEDIDLSHRIVRVRNTDAFSTKTGNQRCIPIPHQLNDLLVQRKRSSGYVLHADKPAVVKGYRWHFFKVFRAVVTAADVSWATHHTCRHTFASLHAQRGVSLFKIAKWLGHTTTETSEIYAHGSDAYDPDVDRSGEGQLAG